MRFIVTALLLVIILTALPLSTLARQPAPEVYAQALGTANLRSGPTTDFDLVGEIANGTEYRVLQQHSQVPWLLLEVPEIPLGAGWVFAELVEVTRGDLTTVPFEEAIRELPPQTGQSTTPLTTPSPTIAGAANPPADPDGANTAPQATAPPAAAPAVNVITATLTGRSNIRYAPGVDYPIIATLDGGTILTVVARHESLPWYQVVVEGAPTGTGWVFDNVVDIDGDINQLGVISQTTFTFPTPTFTPDAVVVMDSPFTTLGSSSGTQLEATLGETVFDYLLSQGLAPRTDREGSVFVLDLLSGEHFTINGGVAYSGMSINKIPVLVSYFIERDQPLEVLDAELVAETMICSENTSTNRMMEIVGDGDILAGGQRITQYMQQLGLGNSFVVAPFFTGNPDATPAPVTSVSTSVDQARTQPDAFNQLTVEEMGWLLGSMYQCAVNNTGPLLDTFPNQINQRECRQMLRVMSGNRIGALIEAGVNPDVATVAHKHGWINNTHGNAGIVFGPEGVYVLSMIYHERTDWLNFEQSFPVIEEVSRQVWNYFNPTYAIQQTSSNDVPEICDIYGETVVADMLGGAVPLPNIPQLQNPVTATPDVSTPEALSATPSLTPSPTLAN